MVIEDERRSALERQGHRLQWLTILWNSFEVFVTVGLGVAVGRERVRATRSTIAPSDGPPYTS